MGQKLGFQRDAFLADDLTDGVLESIQYRG
jgi:hypothetical protein